MAQVFFAMPAGASFSGLKVDQLKLSGETYKPYKGLRGRAPGRVEWKGEEGSWVEFLFLCGGGVTARMQIEVDILFGAKRTAQYALNTVMDRRGILGCLYRTSDEADCETWPLPVQYVLKCFGFGKRDRHWCCSPISETFFVFIQFFNCGDLGLMRQMRMTYNSMGFGIDLVQPLLNQNQRW
jgi:hypothetical protein